MHVRSCLTLCDPMDYSQPWSSVHGVSQARTLEWFVISFSRGSSRPRDQTHMSCNSCTDRCGLYHCTTWDADECYSLSNPGVTSPSWHLLTCLCHCLVSGRTWPHLGLCSTENTCCPDLWWIKSVLQNLVSGSSSASSGSLSETRILRLHSGRPNQN